MSLLASLSSATFALKSGVDRLQLLADRLQLLLRGLEFLINGLQLLVNRLVVPRCWDFSSSFEVSSSSLVVCSGSRSLLARSSTSS